ncbi:MAG: CehA/McbA family metallohydrolase [Anaerolineae bacterium]|nr:CehA/McbA family metallohydrolase [Anaerolineae bacterium]
MHTVASDGTGTHDEVASAAARAGLDFIVYTDHNIWVDGIKGWYRDPATGRDLLRLMGQEINDQALEPELNHMLCHFVSRDLNGIASDPQRLIDDVMQSGGLTFLAHPLERPGLRAASQTYPWITWDIDGYTGIELWNAMTDVKWRLRTLWFRAVLGAYIPNWVLSAPFPEVLAKWDELLATGRQVVAIGGSDAHAMSFSLGPFTRMVYSYEFLFRAVNTHIFISEPLASDIDAARRQIYNALSAGHCFIGNSQAISPRGFEFFGTSGAQKAIMGDGLTLDGAVELCVASPHPAHLRLIKDGRCIAEEFGRELQWHSQEPGVYRVEAYRRYWGEVRGWVFTNPIYVR